VVALDMMDGRVAPSARRWTKAVGGDAHLATREVRQQLLRAFREAAESAPQFATGAYQMDPANSDEACARWRWIWTKGRHVMVKPALAYLTSSGA